MTSWPGRGMQCTSENLNLIVYSLELFKLCSRLWCIGSFGFVAHGLVHPGKPAETCGGMLRPRTHGKLQSKSTVVVLQVAHLSVTDLVPVNVVDVRVSVTSLLCS